MSRKSHAYLIRIAQLANASVVFLCVVLTACETRVSEVDVGQEQQATTQNYAWWTCDCVTRDARNNCIEYRWTNNDLEICPHGEPPAYPCGASNLGQRLSNACDAPAGCGANQIEYECTVNRYLELEWTQVGSATCPAGTGYNLPSFDDCVPGARQCIECVTEWCGDGECNLREDNYSCLEDCACTNDSDCEDGEACSVKKCESNGACSTNRVPCFCGDGICDRIFEDATKCPRDCALTDPCANVTCNDNDYCTINERCSSGVCVSDPNPMCMRPFFR